MYLNRIIWVGVLDALFREVHSKSEIMFYWLHLITCDLIPGKLSWSIKLVL